MYKLIKTRWKMQSGAEFHTVHGDHPDPGIYECWNGGCH